MNDADLRTSLRDFLTRNILKDPNYALEDDEALISSGLIDSFSLVDVALWVEDNFGVHINDTELTASVFDTVAQLASLIQARRAP